MLGAFSVYFDNIKKLFENEIFSYLKFSLKINILMLTSEKIQ